MPAGRPFSSSTGTRRMEIAPHQLDGLLDGVAYRKRQRLSTADLSDRCGSNVSLLGNHPDRDVPIGDDATDNSLLEHDQAAHVGLPHQARGLSHVSALTKKGFGVITSWVR